MNRIRKKIYHKHSGENLTTVRYTGITIAMILILSTFAFPSFSIPIGESQIAAYAIAESGCIVYKHTTLTITVSCSSPVSLTDIYEQLGGAGNSALYKDPNNDGVWALNANVTILAGSTLNIDPKDTKWLKIISDGKTLAYGIHVYGSMKIDSVKVTSWNRETNDYVESHGSREISGKIVHLGAPRPYIRVEHRGTGTTNITNSEIAYLGYEGGWGSGTSGLHYHLAGHGSIIRNNDIHHLYFGFYSVGVGGLVIENNKVHDMGHYGIDPHTGTHDMVIRNNTVYGNNGTAIICSLDCYNILIENNKVYNNTESGITYSRNMTNSVVRNNLVHDQKYAILVSQSHNNEIYNNTISNSNPGITLQNASSANKIYLNSIINSTNATSIKTGAHGNMLYSNTIVLNDTTNAKAIVFDNDSKSLNNTFRDNRIVNTTKT
ncbi:MAG: right-handed parallel beta-helix repeat-containing protein [Nitrososphaeraceae archaeon]